MATPAAVMKLYGWAISPFVSRALLALEEAGVDYELVPMSPQAGDHRRPEHLARNVRTYLAPCLPHSILLDQSVVGFMHRVHLSLRPGWFALPCHILLQPFAMVPVLEDGDLTLFGKCIVHICP
jgi:glutathione S-transferase